MTAAPTPSEVAYIAAQKAVAESEAITSAVFVMLAGAVIVFGIAYLWLWWRETKAKCGAHSFEARSDFVFVDDKWRTIYVRDVCKHCGDAVERKPDEPEASA